MFRAWGLRAAVLGTGVAASAGVAAQTVITVLNPDEVVGAASQGLSLRIEGQELLNTSRVQVGAEVCLVTDRADDAVACTLPALVAPDTLNVLVVVQSGFAFQISNTLPLRVVCGVGQRQVADTCQVCPPGTFQPANDASSCTPCPADTASAVPGADACTPCPEGENALPGAESCSVCGDGVQEFSEECDDGEDNADAPDACRSNCAAPTCGDGIVDSAEACDDGAGNGPVGPCLDDCTAAGVGPTDPDAGGGSDAGTGPDAGSGFDGGSVGDADGAGDAGAGADAGGAGDAGAEADSGGGDGGAADVLEPGADATDPESDTDTPGADAAAGQDAGDPDAEADTAGPGEDGGPGESDDAHDGSGAPDVELPELSDGISGVGLDGCECRQGASLPAGAGWLTVGVLGLLLRRRRG